MASVYGLWKIWLGLVIVFGCVLDCGYMLFNLEFVRWAYSISQWGLFLYLGRIVFSGFSLGPWENLLAVGFGLFPWEFYLQWVVCLHGGRWAVFFYSGF
jgi:hypothetical protein